MVAGELWDPTVTKVVFRRRVLAVISFEDADEVLRIIVPKTGWFGLVGEMIGQRFFAAVAARHRQVAGQAIVERRNVGRTLNRSVTAQCENPAARTADVAEQKLQDGRGANDLNALGMLRPTERIADRCCLIRTRRSDERVRNFLEQGWRDH